MLTWLGACSKSNLRFCFAKDPGWKERHFQQPLKDWEAARAKLIAQIGIEPHVTANTLGASHIHMYFKEYCTLIVGMIGSLLVGIHAHLKS